MRPGIGGITLAAALLAISAGSRVDGGLIVSLDASAVEASAMPVLTTETFNGFSPGMCTGLDRAMGTINSAADGQFSIVPANRYGGAGGKGNDFAIGAESGSGEAATLSLNAPEVGFGLWLWAADNDNDASFFSENELPSSVETPLLLATLATLPDGEQYFGDANHGSDPCEPSVYVNIIAASGTMISSVDSYNSSTTAPGREPDKSSILSTAPTSPLGVIIAAAIAAVPERSWFEICVVACAVIFVASLRRFFLGRLHLAAQSVKGCAPRVSHSGYAGAISPRQHERRRR